MLSYNITFHEFKKRKKKCGVFIYSHAACPVPPQVGSLPRTMILISSMFWISFANGNAVCIMSMKVNADAANPLSKFFLPSATTSPSESVSLQIMVLPDPKPEDGVWKLQSLILFLNTVEPTRLTPSTLEISMSTFAVVIGVEKFASLIATPCRLKVGIAGIKKPILTVTAPTPSTASNISGCINSKIVGKIKRLEKQYIQLVNLIDVF